MPPVRSSRNRKPPPDGFDDIEDTLLEFANKMKDAENAPHEGKKRSEVLWPIFQISHQSSSHFPRLLFVIADQHCLQGQGTSTNCITRKRPSPNSYTTGYSRTAMLTEI